jgi:TetR/AcrR family transcriptional regulator, repressor for uid operon
VIQKERAFVLFIDFVYLGCRSAKKALARGATVISGPQAGTIMPKLKPDTQRARRDHILDAALKCFARSGFHATTMQDICKAAEVSPGAVYVYFASKEDLIAGLCERDRNEFAERFSQLASAPDFLDALQGIGEHYFVEMSPDRQLFVVEMGVESTRNPRIAEIFMSVDKYCCDNFQALFQRLKDEGRIAPIVDIPTLAKVFNVIGDGMFWRRAIEPGFDARAVLPAIIELIGTMLNPVNAGAQRAAHLRDVAHDLKKGAGL